MVVNRGNIHAAAILLICCFYAPLVESFVGGRCMIGHRVNNDYKHADCASSVIRTFLRAAGNAVDNGGKHFGRREVIVESALTLSTLLYNPSKALAAISNGETPQKGLDTISPTASPSTEKQIVIKVPLEFNGRELLIRYRVDGSLFTAVVDTGSPFLMIPGSCGANTVRRSGCYKQQGVPSGFSDTYEQFDGFEGNVEWRMAPVSLEGAQGHLYGPRQVVFGVASESILSGPGGVFFGLIRDTDSWIRPSFLGQTMVQSLKLDLRETPEPEELESVSPMSGSPTRPKALMLSTKPMIPPVKTSSAIQMTNNLRRKYGDPVTHYTVQASSITVNGYPLAATDGKPIYVILDTGTTGMVVSQELFDQRYQEARQRKEKSLWGRVDLALPRVGGEGAQRLSWRQTPRTPSFTGNEFVLSATKPLTTPFDLRKTWGKRFNGHLLVVGLAFLVGHQITIDIDRQLVLFEDNPKLE